jgi:hypothetical protein
MRQDSFAKAGLVEYNFACFKKAIAQLLEAKQKFKDSGSSSSSGGGSSGSAGAAGRSEAKSEAKAVRLFCPPPTFCPLCCSVLFDLD